MTSLKFRTLMFVDSAVDDCQFLERGVRDGVQVRIIERDRDGIEQITAQIQKFATTYGLIDEIHLFSHGSPGHLYLGNSILSSNTLEKYRSQLQQWREALSENANLLLYGCHVAAGKGAAFVRQISQLTKVNIAASVDLTGSAAKGGNWNLAFTTGEIKAHLVFKPEVMEAYNFVAGGVVGNGTPGSITEAALTTALAGGGSVTFNSGGVPVTLNLTSEKTIIADTTIDGGGLITLSGGGNNRIFSTGNFLNFTVKNITLANGFTSGNGGAILAGFQNNLTFDNSQFLNNIAAGGGAIFTNSRNTVVVTNSKFDRNDGTSGNLERGGGAIALNGLGSLTVRDSEFTNNKGINGGAINTVTSALTVENSTFLNNDSTPGGSGVRTRGYGGAIYTDGASDDNNPDSGTILIRNSRFDGNKGAGQGGGLFLYAYAPDKIRIEGSTVVNNQLIKNASGDSFGGGIRHGNSELIVSNTTFANNLALSQGGGLWVGENSPVTITNSTFSGNKADDSTGNGLGGAIAFNNTSTNTTNIFNTTIANNRAGGFAGAIFSGQQPIAVKNTIFANNSAGNQFNVKQQSNRELIDGGNNLQFPGKLTNESTDSNVTATINISDPLLGSLQDNGGGILTHALPATSPAINAGANVPGLITDQRGVLRDESVDIGAFEFDTSSPASRIFTPNDDGVTLTGGNDFGDALSGNDFVFLLGGNDTLFGNSGNDTIFGGEDFDLINGNQGDDSINGNQGNDTLRGGQDNDLLRGGQGNDLLLGDLGNDVLLGDFGNDTLIGGAGSDRFALTASFGTDTILDFEDSQDLLALGGGLNFGELSIAQGSNATLISIASSGELLAILNGISANAIGIGDFTAM